MLCSSEKLKISQVACGSLQLVDQMITLSCPRGMGTTNSSTSELSHPFSISISTMPHLVSGEPRVGSGVYADPQDLLQRVASHWCLPTVKKSFGTLHRLMFCYYQLNHQLCHAMVVPRFMQMKGL